MTDSYQGSAVLVTGAASGIGRATAKRFAAGGARLCCFDIDEAGAETTAAAIREQGGDAFSCCGDVSSEVDTKATVSAALERFGQLDVLANVAGIGHFRHTEEESAEEWNRILGVNLTGAFLMARDAIPALLDTRGVIVNVASVAGLSAHPYAAAYGASKGGVVLLTKTLALEYASRGLRVNAVCPSGVVTPILDQFTRPDEAEESLFMRIVAPNCNLIEPEEIACAIEFLASPEMPNMTGAIVVVDGGVTV
ncbi:MAG: Glucose 1-dehydrogenase 1 [Acidimicrobiales bacterium]|nr:Glucose 1-dehydrogenase 1 [Acidimicrobiales bacterium]